MTDAAMSADGDDDDDEYDDEAFEATMKLARQIFDLMWDGNCNEAACLFALRLNMEEILRNCPEDKRVEYAEHIAGVVVQKVRESLG
jgi:hypothetical protein